MNTQKQVIIMVALVFLTVGACAGYTVIELPYRTQLQADWHLEQSIERGALLYANNCRTCHGNAGEGFVGPRLNSDALKSQDPLELAANRAMIERTLLCGRAGTLMPAWLSANGGSLNEVQIQHLVNFITAPIDEDVLDEDGLPSNTGWVEAVHFAHNLNHETTILVAGDTLQSIASQHRIGIAELAAANGLPADDPEMTLTSGSVLRLPPVGGAPDGGEFKVEGNNVTLRRAAERTFVGAAILADANNLEYELDYSGPEFTLLEGGVGVPGLITGQLLALPSGSVYVANSGDTLEIVAGLHGLTVEELVAANPDHADTPADEDLAPVDDEGNIPTVVLNLPAGIDAYRVRGQTWDDVAAGYGNVTGASLAEANGLATNVSLRIGQSLSLPEDAYGSAPPDTINRGTACVQFAVPNSIYEAIVGGGSIGGEPFEGTVVGVDNTFRQTQITLPPGIEYSVVFDHQDEGIMHNIQFFNSPTPGQGGFLTGCIEGCDPAAGDELRTQVSVGPVQQTFTFSTPAVGIYGYNCAIHPDTMTGTLTIEEGAEIPGQ